MLSGAPRPSLASHLLPKVTMGHNDAIIISPLTPINPALVSSSLEVGVSDEIKISSLCPMVNYAPQLRLLSSSFAFASARSEPNGDLSSAFSLRVLSY